MADTIQTLHLKDDPTTNVFPNIVGDNIPDGAVVESKLGASSVTSTKIASSAVTAGKIASSAVTEGKIASNAITTTKIADLNITGAKIANSAITEGKIQNGVIGKMKLKYTSAFLSTLLTGITTIADLYSALRNLILKPFARFYWNYGNGSTTMEIQVFNLLGSYTIKYSKSDLSGYTTLSSDSDVPSFLLNAQDIFIEYLGE